MSSAAVRCTRDHIVQCQLRIDKLLRRSPVLDASEIAHLGHVPGAALPPKLT